jgi:hypothetical protein
MLRHPGEEYLKENTLPVSVILKNFMEQSLKVGLWLVKKFHDFMEPEG